MKKISVIGLGYVGLPTFLVLANVRIKNSYIYSVSGIEKDDKHGIFIKSCFENKKNWIKNNDPTFKKYLKNSFSRKDVVLRTDLNKINDTDIIIVSINFEVNNSNKNIFSNIVQLSQQIAAKIKKKTLIIFESTLPPGTCENIILPVFKKILKKRSLNLKDIYFAYAFERVMPGKNYINSIKFNYRCYSGINKESKIKCRNFLRTFIDYKKFNLTELNNITECESTKILENSYRAINISLIDEWTKISNILNINLPKIINAIKLRPTHSNMMRPGLGVGGYCLTKDPTFINFSLKNFFNKKASFPIISNAMKVNSNMEKTSLNYIMSKVNKLNKKKILLCGLTYKEDTADFRFSPSITLLKLLKKKGGVISVHDPYIEKNKNLFKNYNIEKKFNGKKYDLIIFCTSHQKFNKIRPNDIAKKTIIFDVNKSLTTKQIDLFNKKKYKLNILGAN